MPATPPPVVLPSVLLLVTASRTGAERQHFLDLTGIAPGEYDPHSRDTAMQAGKSDANVE